MTLDKERLLKIYQGMVMIHRFEEVIEEYVVNRTIPGSVHLFVGQEACQADVVNALKKTNYKFPDHRGHGATALCGTDPKLVMAKIFTRETGINHGRSGSMRVNDLECRNTGFNGIQDSTVVTYLGTAFASVYNGTDDITAVFLGDETLRGKTCHESMNMAAVQKLPIIHCPVNSGYTISTRYEEAHPQKELETWGEGYEVPSFRLDGNDIETVIEAVGKAVSRAGKGEGLTVLELMTYRWQGHFTGDPAAYRPEDKVSYWANDRDPLKLTKTVLLGREQVESAMLQAVKGGEEKHMQEMFKFSLESEYPGIETITTYTYADREVELR